MYPYLHLPISYQLLKNPPKNRDIPYQGNIGMTPFYLFGGSSANSIQAFFSRRPSTFPCCLLDNAGPKLQAQRGTLRKIVVAGSAAAQAGQPVVDEDLGSQKTPPPPPKQKL